jgi:imidazolonepropionase-like amidohydrolase
MSVTVLRNASVLDADRAELAEGQSVVVEDGRIADIGPGLSGPDDAVVIDIAGKTVMPGLIDAHTHPTSVSMDFAASEWSPTYVAARAGRALEGMLARGFTSIRDVGGGEHGLAQAVEERYFTGPRIFYGGKQLSQTGGAGGGPPRRAPHQGLPQRCRGRPQRPGGLHPVLGRGTQRDRGGGHGGQHLRGRPCLHFARHQPVLREVKEGHRSMAVTVLRKCGGI